MRALAQARRALAAIVAAADPRYRERLREPLARAVESSALDLTEFLLGIRPRASFTGPQHEMVLEIVRLGIPFRGNARWKPTRRSASPSRSAEKGLYFLGTRSG